MSGEGAVNVQVQKARRLHDADVVYLYDSSFEGFLCCVFESFAQHEIPFAVWTPQRETSTLYPVKDIPTDHAKAQRVFASFGRKLGPETEYLVSRDFLSGREDKELLLIRFLHLAFALGPGTVKRTGHPDVAPLYEMKKSLDWEVDKFQGFVRFEEHDGMLGAVIHPKNYILPLLRPHFCGRFPEENFMIYDAVHQAVLLQEDHKARLLELAAPLELPPPMPMPVETVPLCAVPSVELSPALRVYALSATTSADEKRMKFAPHLAVPLYTALPSASSIVKFSSAAIRLLCVLPGMPPKPVEP